MGLSNPNAKTSVMGFNVPNVIMYGILAVVVFIVISLWKVIRNAFNSVSNIFGGSDNSDDIVKDTIKKLEDNPTIKANMTAGNQAKASALLKAMEGPGTDEETIHKIFATITGAGQFAAIYCMFGTRTLQPMPAALSFIPVVLWSNVGGTFTGDLIGCLRNELSADELNKKPSASQFSIEQKFTYLNQFK